MDISLKKQRGAALIVTLVLLVAALILGVSSYQNSRLEESMSGNQRASSLALMAAEYGASDFWYSVKSGVVPGPGAPDPSDDANSYMVKILEALSTWVAAGGSSGVGECAPLEHNGINPVPNACYVLAVSSPAGDNVAIAVDGLVYSGSTAGISYTASGGLDAPPVNLVARRRVGMKWGVVIGETLSPFNYVGELFDYAGINSQSTISGEEDVDGYINPAVSVGSRVDAEKIVRDILNNNDSKFNDNVIFIPDNSGDYNAEGSYGDDIEGVYHDKSVVDFSGSIPIYTGDYSTCDNQSSNLCNYKGGVASKLGAPILSNPDAFDDFVGKLVNQPETIWGNAATVESAAVDPENQDAAGKVFFVTNQPEGSYSRPVWDDERIREAAANDPADERLERDLNNLGGFDHKGILIIDGDVEFDGNPEFEGLIIVLGDYNINGSGNEPFVGAIISAPYSLHYYDADGNVVNPKRDDVTGEFVNEAGESIAGADSKVVFNDNGTPEDITDDFPVIVDTNGNIVLADGVPVDPYFPNVVGSPSRRFDPIGVDVNGGGKQPYVYDYSVIEAAFDLFDDDTLLAYLIGQAKPDGSYEYGLSSWTEKVAY